MFMNLAIAATLALSVQVVRADDSIAPETVEAVKKATVFIRIEGDGWGGSGSGFVVSADEKRVLVATNHHVAVPKLPPGVRAGAKPVTLTVVFDSGTKTERSYSATVAAGDAELDLAVLRITGVKDAPRPLASADQAKLVETMQVFSFGYPFGSALATTKGSPAVTVGKASISSLRNGADGELSVIQIDGNLNPGNSGGPIVDVKGRLVGVAVAKIRDGQGIGFAVPGAELSKVMQGRIGKVKVTAKKQTDGRVTVRIEAELIDPADSLVSAVAHYFVIPPKTKRPEALALDKHPGSKKLELKIEKGLAVAELTMSEAEGEILVQVAGLATGKSPVSTQVRVYSLAAGPSGAALAGPPPAGWKDFTPKDKTFVMWVPEKPATQTEAERTSVVGGVEVRVNAVTGKTAAGLSYEGRSVLLPASFAQLSQKDVFDLFRGAIAADFKGRVTDTKETELVNLTGVEYLIEAGTSHARARIFVSGTRLYVVSVSGPAVDVTGAEATTILGAYRLPSASSVAGKEPTEASGPKGKDPTIIAGGSAPLFKDVAPGEGTSHRPRDWAWEIWQR